MGYLLVVFTLDVGDVHFAQETENQPKQSILRVKLARQSSKHALEDLFLVVMAHEERSCLKRERREDETAAAKKTLKLSNEDEAKPEPKPETTHQQVQVWLVRHGQCEMNLSVAERVGGRSNSSPLTQLGKDQAHQLGVWLREQGVTFDAVFASVAVRARETAKIMVKSMEQETKVPIRLDDRLVELEQGEWSDKLRKECYSGETLEEIAKDPRNFKAPGGESKQELETRILEAIHEATDPTKGRHNIAIVGHGVAFKAFIRWLNDAPWATSHTVALDNTGLIRATRIGTHNTPDAWMLGQVNIQDHLS